MFGSLACEWRVALGHSGRTLLLLSYVILYQVTTLSVNLLIHQ